MVGLQGHQQEELKGMCHDLFQAGGLNPIYIYILKYIIRTKCGSLVTISAIPCSSMWLNALIVRGKYSLLSLAGSCQGMQLSRGDKQKPPAVNIEGFQVGQEKQGGCWNRAFSPVVQSTRRV
jgi:hypothetical protein